jgi:WD40 repeat protein/serine/threonine protein kinase
MSEPAGDAEAIFLAALDRATPQERAAFVEGACAGRPALRQRVQALLAAHDELHGPLDAPPYRAATIDQAPLVEKPGTHIGPYKLLEQIGEGGMGVVYMAEQQEPVRRMVALKIIKPGMDSGQVLARFEAERQALALMDHPNIARVFDAGATPDGRPYFVMELVKGTPITAFCDANKLPARQRLELFVPVCQAIQHAHQKGVIHRDIKPSNVLIALYDDKPVPKVIDFGIAKAAGQPLTERTLHTGFGAIVGTPEYMSPEQATFNQLDIDTRSDVYSLGVLLYELLTGTTPVDKARFKDAAILEMLRVVREEEPARPSVKLSTTAARASIAATRGTEPDKLAQLLRGELDWIVMKALEKDRNRRYETAAGLARDVDRYLQDELVEARPPSVGYRLRKLVKRHRGPVLAAALVLLALVGGIAGTTWGLFEAQRQRDDADLARLDEITHRTKALAAEGRTAKALMRSEGLRLLLQSELTRPSNPSLALLLAIEGAERHPGLLANNTLLAALDQGREERTLPVAGTILCFSADGRRLLIAWPWNLRIWDVPAGKELVRIENKEHAIGPAGAQPFKAACFDPDGKRFLTTSVFGRVRLWDAATGKALALLDEGVSRVYHFGKLGPRNWTAEEACPAQFSPDGRFILTSDGQARLWDAASGKEHLVLQGHEGSVLWAEFSRDGKQIITASRDTTARIWDAASGKQLHVLKGHATNAMLMACFSPDGARALTVTSVRDSVGSNTSGPFCRLWDSQTGKELATLGTPGNIPTAQFSPDGSRILTYDYYNMAGKRPHWNFWDARSGKHLGVAGTDVRHVAAAFSPDGERVAFFGYPSKEVELWNAKTLERIDSVRGHDARVNAVMFSPDRQRLATADQTGVHIWAVAGEAERRLGRWTALPFLALSQDGRSLATRSLDPKEVAIWHLTTARELSRIKGKGFPEVTFARFSPDGRKIIFGSKNRYREGAACVGDVRTGQRTAVLPGGAGLLLDADISPDGVRAVTVYHFFSGLGLRIWDLAAGKELAAQKPDPRDSYTGLARFSPDGRWLLTSHDWAARVRDAASGQVAAVLNFGPGVLRGLAFSPDGRRVLTVWLSNPDTGHVSDTATGKQLAMLKGPPNAHLRAPAFSSDGASIIMACDDRTARIWETASGKELLVLKGHDDQIAAASFSPDNTRIVTAAADKTVRLWDARTGELRAVFHGHQEAVQFAQFIPDGQVLSVDQSGAARVWPVDPLPAARARAARELTPEERKQYEVPPASRR